MRKNCGRSSRSLQTIDAGKMSARIALTETEIAEMKGSIAAKKQLVRCREG